MLIIMCMLGIYVTSKSSTFIRYHSEKWAIIYDAQIQKNR